MQIIPPQKLANQIQQYMKKIIHNEWDLSMGYKNGLT